jgi:hypothetical protein
MKTQDGQSTVKYMEKKRRRKKNPRETHTHTHTYENNWRDAFRKGEAQGKKENIFQGWADEREPLAVDSDDGTVIASRL